jgi:predicted double-glycine peptidase
MAILTDAVQYIEELQEEAATLRMKMQSLRQTLLPHGIWKYTMND